MINIRWILTLIALPTFFFSCEKEEVSAPTDGNLIGTWQATEIKIQSLDNPGVITNKDLSIWLFLASDYYGYNYYSGQWTLTDQTLTL
ncbi:hypothetical protein AB9P05_01585 [Roseivirga sp. BDSF3-8]|uniref:hypothetical protein n=1 Tax=Roseivirga sp. BDSF3-8 TaxID=3241598 RepID=UPI003531862F